MEISLRDPGGQTCLVDNRVLRVVNKKGLNDLAGFLCSSSSAWFVKSKQLVNSSFLSATATEEVLKYAEVRSIYSNLEGASIVEHERIPFPSFPYEWPPEMLYAAATLTLDFAETLTDEGLGLKDASPYNVLFRGSKPVFVDLLSFERRDPRDPTHFFAPAVNQQTLWNRFVPTPDEPSRWRRARRSVSSLESDSKTSVTISFAGVNAGLANAEAH